MEASDSPEESVECIKQLPEINQKSLMHILRFLQVFSKPTVTHLTRMDSGMFHSISFFYQMFTRMNDDFIKTILLKLISQSRNGYGSKLFSSVE